MARARSEDVPVILAGVQRERRRHHDDLSACRDQPPVELREAHVVANREPHSEAGEIEALSSHHRASCCSTPAGRCRPRGPRRTSAACDTRRAACAPARRRARCCMDARGSSSPRASPGDHHGVRRVGHLEQRSLDGGLVVADPLCVRALAGFGPKYGGNSRVGRRFARRGALHRRRPAGRSRGSEVRRRSSTAESPRARARSALSGEFGDGSSLTTRQSNHRDPRRARHTLGSKARWRRKRQEPCSRSTRRAPNPSEAPRPA